jgi:choline dehydrogenase
MDRMTQTYDFIIVGAGSAGCVLADRLTACGRYSVLLVEAGGTDRRLWIKLPVGYAYTFSNPAVNWCFNAEPDAGLNGREAYWPRGKVMGGSSSINAMAYVRGLPHDYDDWQGSGADGWGWDAVKSMFDTLECHDELAADGTRHLRGNGPVRITDLSDQMHPFTRHFTAAARDMGWATSSDINATTGDALATVRSTVQRGHRWSAADAFLRPALKRPNLRVIKNAHVGKVLLTEGRATGIDYRQGPDPHQAYAAREVILSAGALQSPQLLQLSGIGPAALLKNHGVDVKHDLPQVGHGLQDHLAVSHFYWATEATLNAQIGSWRGRALAGIEYLFKRRGPLAVPVNQISGFVSSAGASRPDVQVYCNPASYYTRASGTPQVDRENGFLLCVQPSRPTSRGSVAIRSADPFAPPVIQPNSLATEADQKNAVSASRLLQSLMKTPSIASVTKARRDPDILDMDDDALLENFRNRAGSVFHPTSTCRMGYTAHASVLDARLRVHGVRGLRVVDASAFPNITSGNTNAPTLMLAARAGEMILHDQMEE